MNETTERILIEALDLLEQGASIDEIIARYPAQAADLRPFLLTAASLGNLANQPTVTAEARSKRAFQDAADQAAAERNKPARAAGSWLRRLVAPALAVLAVLFLGGAGLVGASGSAVPGDALYDTKRLVEEVRLNLTANPETAAQLRERFRRERVREIEALLATGRAAEVSLTGEVESMVDGRWTVAGVPVLVSPATVIDGRPVVGALVQVDGLTSDQAVVAGRVMVLTAGPALDPTPVGAETPSPSPRPSPTPPPSGTTMTSGSDDDNDNSGDDDAPVVPPPGSRPDAPASATAPAATPDDDGDDNTNDNGADNDDDGGDDNDNNDGAGDNTNDNDDSGANDNDDGGGDDNDNNDGGGDNTNDNDDAAANDNDDAAANDNDDAAANDNDDGGDANDNDDGGGDNGDDGGNSGSDNSDDNDNGDADDDGGGDDNGGD